jgi:hypothetical protein
VTQKKCLPNRTRKAVKMLGRLSDQPTQHREFWQTQFFIMLFRHPLTEQYVEVLRINELFPLVVPLEYFKQDCFIILFHYPLTEQQQELKKDLSTST